jgi:hypothetical protein
MAEFVYILCTLTSIACAALLLLDLYVFPEIDLVVVRTGSALIAMSLLLYSLIWNVR